MSLITEKEALKFTKEKLYEEMWILTEMDIFAINPVIKNYRGCPPGDSPELCNLYYCVRKYLHKAVGFHVRDTHSLHKLDPKRFW